MKIEYGINPNCSEAVFRFYTLDPKQIQTILQAIADEINANTDFKPHKNQKVPLFKTAKEYDTNYKKASDKEWNRHFKFLNGLRLSFDIKKVTQAQYDKAYVKEEERFKKLKYPKDSILKACAGLGDNEAIIKIEKEKKAFRLNIGNNDISVNKTGWTEVVKALGIKVEEASFSENLQKVARDCTCGCVFFEGYENLIKDEK